MCLGSYHGQAEVIICNFFLEEKHWPEVYPLGVFLNPHCNIVSLIQCNILLRVMHPD